VTVSQPDGTTADVDEQRPPARTQVRRYQIEDGRMDEFMHYWHVLVAQRQKFGFRVVFAYVDETNNEVVWAVEHDGDFKAAENAYFQSEERAATLAEAPRVMTGAKIGMARRVM